MNNTPPIETTRSRTVVIGLGALGIGLVAYLGTRSPLIAAAVPCILAAAPLIRAGWWLFANDVDSSRGWTCLAFYASGGAWRATASAVASVFFFVFVGDALGVRLDDDHLLWTGAIMLGGVLVTTLLSVLAVAMSLVNGHKVWVRPDVRRACQADATRLAGMTLNNYRFNYGVFVLVMSIAGPTLILGTAVLIAVTAKPDLDAVNPVAGAVALGNLMLVSPIAILIACGRLASRIIARTPAECWGDNG